jgi:hypothetical protein
MRPTVVTGPGPGGTLTALLVMENAAEHQFDISTLYTFRSPRILLARHGNVSASAESELCGAGKLCVLE